MGRPMMTVGQADRVSLAWIEANVDLDLAREDYDRCPFQAEYEKMERPSSYRPIGEWVMSRDGMIYAVAEVRVDECEPSERDWEVALRYRSTRLYTAWFKQGYRPPPIFLIRHVDGRLLSMNRRRWLAARAAGVETLLAFYSPTLPSGRPAWELKPCTWDEDRVCREYAEGGSCITCPHYEECKDDETG